MASALRIEDLDYLDEEFIEAEEPEGFSKIPDGNYTARVEAARAEMSQDGQTPKLSWELIIVGGEYDGRHLFRSNFLKDSRNVGWLKKDLRACEIDIDSPSFKVSEFLVSGTEQLLDLILDITVKNKKYTDRDGNEKESTNTYINGIADVDADGDDPDEQPFDDTGITEPNYDAPETEAKELPRSSASSRRPAPTSTRGGGRTAASGTASGAKKENPFR